MALDHIDIAQPERDIKQWQEIIHEFQKDQFNNSVEKKRDENIVCKCVYLEIEPTAYAFTGVVRIVPVFDDFQGR